LRCPLTRERSFYDREVGRLEGTAMSAIDKAKNTAQDTKGKAKEAAGRATGDDHLEAEGHADQTDAGVKKAVEAVKDVFHS
jgi:uncharacterized protein YjbJ (UPF0337 family)